MQRGVLLLPIIRPGPERNELRRTFRGLLGRGFADLYLEDLNVIGDELGRR